jgi:hypothetical protein
VALTVLIKESSYHFIILILLRLLSQILLELKMHGALSESNE